MCAPWRLVVAAQLTLSHFVVVVVIGAFVRAQGVSDYFAQLPAVDNPEIFGMHENASVTFNTNESLGLMQTVSARCCRGYCCCCWLLLVVVVAAVAVLLLLLLLLMLLMLLLVVVGIGILVVGLILTSKPSPKPIPWSQAGPNHSGGEQIPNVIDLHAIVCVSPRHASQSLIRKRTQYRRRNPVRNHAFFFTPCASSMESVPTNPIPPSPVRLKRDESIDRPTDRPTQFLAIPAPN